MLPPYYFFWFRIDNKHMTEPWLDQALMDVAYRSDNGLRIMAFKYIAPMIHLLTNNISEG